MAAFTALAIGLLVAGTVSKTVGKIKEGNAAERAGKAGQEAANSQADLADWNAQVADLQAKDAVVRGAHDESRFREGVNQMIGSQRSGIAASGVDVNSGSAVDVQADTRHLGELDALTIRTNAAREAWGYQVQGQDLRRRAEITRKEGVNIAEAGKVAKSASRSAAVGTIATGVGDVATYGAKRGVS